MVANATKCASNAILKARKILKQPAIFKKQRYEPSKVGKKDQTDARAGYKPRKSRFEGEKEIKKAGGSGKIKRTKMAVFFLSDC